MTRYSNTVRMADLRKGKGMKAFDKVPHAKLILKILSYGIKGNIINWIIDLLAHSKQRVWINNIFSNWQEVISGIPQGSVIGPLLFYLHKRFT